MSFWPCSALMLIPISASYFSNMVISASTTPTSTGMRGIVHIAAVSSFGSMYLLIFSCFFFIMRGSRSMQYFVILEYFLQICTKLTSDLRASIRELRWIVKSHDVLYYLFTVTFSYSCSYHFHALFRLHLSHSLIYTNIANSSRLLLY